MVGTLRLIVFSLLNSVLSWLRKTRWVPCFCQFSVKLAKKVSLAFFRLRFVIVCQSHRSNDPIFDKRIFDLSLLPLFSLQSSFHNIQCRLFSILVSGFLLLFFRFLQVPKVVMGGLFCRQIFQGDICDWRTNLTVTYDDCGIHPHWLK